MAFFCCPKESLNSLTCVVPGCGVEARVCWYVYVHLKTLPYHEIELPKPLMEHVVQAVTAEELDEKEGHQSWGQCNPNSMGTFGNISALWRVSFLFKAQQASRASPGSSGWPGSAPGCHSCLRRPSTKCRKKNSIIFLSLICSPQYA